MAGWWEKLLGQKRGENGGQSGGGGRAVEQVSATSDEGRSRGLEVKYDITLPGGPGVPIFHYRKKPEGGPPTGESR